MSKRLIFSRSNQSHPLRWLLRTLKWLFVIAILLLLTGYIYHFVADEVDRRAFDPPGTILTVEGLDMHLWCVGEDIGGPTYILDAGLSESSIYWSEVMTALAPTHHVCAFDRPGMGWSEPANSPRTYDAVADRMNALFEAASLDSPFVIVGFSIGGLYSRTFVGKYRDKVAGLILVDSSHEDQFRRFGADTQEIEDGWRRCYWLDMVGYRRLTDNVQVAPSMPDDQKPAARSRAALSHFCGAIADETAGANLDLLERLRNERDYGDLPVIILTATQKPDDRRDLWLELQNSFLSLSSNTQQIFAEESTHRIHATELNIVLQAFNDMQAQLNPIQPEQ